MKFSVCMPNYNYEQYVAESVLSALRQDVDLQLVICDNASTDRSVEVIQRAADHRVKLIVNQWNIGFAGNLRKTTALADGDYRIVLSSDDIMEPDALSHYDKLIDLLGDRAPTSLIAAGHFDIDGAGVRSGRFVMDDRMWVAPEREDAFSVALGADVYSMAARDLLHHGLKILRMPLPFVATCYSRQLFESVEGYHAGRFISPDKAFCWKLLTRADRVYFIDKPLFGYRWHGNNQNHIEAREGALKYLVDQYVYTFDVDAETLVAGRISRDELRQAFLREDIELRGLKLLALGDRARARRGVDFAKATFPHLPKSRYWWALRGLLLLGPMGSLLASHIYRRMNLPRRSGPGSV